MNMDTVVVQRIVRKYFDDQTYTALWTGRADATKIYLQALRAGEQLMVRTLNSLYRIRVADPNEGLISVIGGEFFGKRAQRVRQHLPRSWTWPTATLIGSTFGA